MKHLLLNTMIALATIAGLSSCHTAANQPANTGVPAPGNYTVVSVKAQSITAHLDFPATLQGEQVIEIRPMISGYVETIDVHEGATVKKGQLLFTIKNPQYEQDLRSAEGSIKSAEADVASAKMSVNKVRPLVEKDIVSKYELESAEYTLQAKEATLVQAKATLANARINLGYTRIYSDHDGVIGTIPYKVGALVSSTSTSALTELSDISKVYAYFSLDEKQLLQMLGNTPGSNLQDQLDHFPRVSLVLADGSAYPTNGKLETASGLVTTATGSTAFKALFDNPKSILRSGASAVLRIPHHIDSALLIPQSATAEIQDKRLVYVVGADNKVHAVTITTTPTDDGKYFIVSEGLKEGDKIVLDGITRLKDSLTINPVPAQ